MQVKQKQTDVLIIGASASGLMCAIEAGKRGRKVTVLDHANKAGKKILMSGGGRCNFTNTDISADNYLSHNPHFCKSALSRYTQWDFIAMVNTHKIPYHERDLGKLFCDVSAKQILDMLLDECKKAKVKIQLNCVIDDIQQLNNHAYLISTNIETFKADSLVVACGGLSIPKMCASPLGYKIAEQFGHNILATRAGLVPLTLQPEDKNRLQTLAGIAIKSHVSHDEITNAGIRHESMSFKENILFTHRGLSGPAILQISSYWRAGQNLNINLLPDIDLQNYLLARQKKQPAIKLKTALLDVLPKRLLNAFLDDDWLNKPLQEISQVRFKQCAQRLQKWQLKPNGTEGYRTAEVTIGGVDCNELSSKTMQSRKVKGLYFVGEVVDVTGWLGGYNFQWAWSSGWCAGQVV